MGRELTELDGDLDENWDILPWKNKGNILWGHGDFTVKNKGLEMIEM
jgi:hypothetical protein